LNILYIRTCTGTWKSCRTLCGGRRRRRIFFEHIIYTYMYRDLEQLQDLIWGEEEEEDFTHMPLLKNISAALIKKGFYSRPVIFFSKELTENGGKNAKEKLEQFRKWASDLRATVTQNEVGEIDVYVCI